MIELNTKARALQMVAIPAEPATDAAALIAAYDTWREGTVLNGGGKRLVAEFRVLAIHKEPGVHQMIVWYTAS